MGRVYEYQQGSSCQSFRMGHIPHTLTGAQVTGDFDQVLEAAILRFL